MARMLSELKPSEITSLPNWGECVSLAFHCLPWPGQHEKVLRAWADSIDIADLRFADVVLFYIVRHLPFSRDVWIEKCTALATETKDESLFKNSAARRAD